MIMFETYIILIIKSNSDRYLWLVNISQRVYAFTNIIWYLVSINKRLCQDSISKNTIIIKWKNVFLTYAKIIHLNIYIRSIWIIYILHVQYSPNQCIAYCIDLGILNMYFRHNFLRKALLFCHFFLFKPLICLWFLLRKKIA